MKVKVLIITYFFPPCNLTASQRAGGWSKYLHEYDVYPIILTRHWDNPINETKDVLIASGKELKIEKTINSEIHYVPFKPNFRDRIYTLLYKTPFRKLSKLFTYLLLYLENYSIKFIGHKNLYYRAREILKKNPDIKVVVISGNPFNLFFFGYKLKKEFPIEWIADYRDDWNTSDIESKPKGLNKLLANIQAKSEQKWLSNAVHFTSVSPYYVNKIENFIKTKGSVVLNGYDELESINREFEDLNSEAFTITYNGSLYPTQPIEPIINAVIELFKKGYEIRVNFPGLAYDKAQETRIKNAFIGFEKNVKITNRISRNEVIKIQLQSDLLLMISHSKTKGIPSSKLYEYIGLRKPVLLYPNDNDIIEETLNNTRLGYICDNEHDIISKIENLIISKKSGVKIDSNYNVDEIEKYSRRKQTKVIASIILDSIK